MISNFVNQGFDAAQKGVYGIGASLSNQGKNVIENLDRIYYKDVEGRRGYQENHHPFISRLAGIPISIIDVTLECVRPLFLAIESAGFAAISLIAVLWNVLRLDPSSVGRALRLTILNLHNTVENALLVPLKVAMSPIQALSQILLFLRDPNQTLPSSKPIDPDGKKFCTDLIMGEIQKDLFLSVQAYAGNEGFSYSADPENKHPILSRIRAVSLSFGEVILNVIKPILRLIADLILGTLLVGVGLVKLIKGDGLSRLTFGLRFFGDLPNGIAQLITSIVFSPITLIAQIGSALRNPQKIAPSSAWLYMSQKYDSRATITLDRKIQDPTDKSYDNEYVADQKEWEPASARNALPQEETDSIQDQQEERTDSSNPNREVGQSERRNNNNNNNYYTHDTRNIDNGGYYNSSW